MVAPPLASFAGVVMDANGWTVVTASSDSRVVYVSISLGNDANDGLSPTTPKASLAAANELIRDGYPDHLLLRRGDTFAADGSTLYRWKNGRSATEPVLLSYYGESGDRPVIEISGGFIDHNGQARNYQAFIGLDIYKSNSDPASPAFADVSASEGLRFVGGGADLLIEDCRFRFVGIVVQSYDPARYTNVKLRRNIVLDVWTHGSFTEGNRIQGLYMDGVAGYLLEENFFDHNGWSEVIPDAGANQYSHNVYINYTNAEGGIMRGNIFARGAAHGLQARSGGVVERNLFVLNAVSVNIGGVATPTDPDVLTFPNAALDNVVINGRAMHPTNWEWPRTAALWGISVPGYIQDVFVDGNIVANRVDDASNAAYEGIENMEFGSNLSYRWDPTVDTFDPAWPHPDDDLGDFYASVGGTNSTTAYLESLRERGPGELTWNQTAYAAASYIRAGFNRPPIHGPYAYEGDPTVVVTLAATDGAAAEPGENGRFTLTASRAPAAPVTVNLVVSGTATNGTDYVEIPATAVIGTSGSATIDVVVTDDRLPEVTENVRIAVVAGDGYRVGTADQAVVTLADDDSAGLPVVRIESGDASAAEPGDDAQLVVTVSPAPRRSLQVDLEIGGTADNGQDYVRIRPRLTIGSSGRATVDVRVREDRRIEDTETVVITIAQRSGYLVDPEAKTASVTIDDDTPIVSVIASDPSAAESGDPGQVALVADPRPTAPLHVRVEITGTATRWTDYERLPNRVTIGASGTATIDIQPRNDTQLEGTESVVVTLLPGSRYRVGSPSAATVKIDDDEDDLPPPWESDDVGSVGMAGDASYAPGVFTVSGSGLDIWGGADQFHFVHRPAAGDCDIRARVVSQENTGSDAKAGVMIRATLDADSPHALMEIIPRGAAEFIFRPSAGANSDYADGGAASTPVWLRVARSGDTFTTYRSADGNTWTPVGQAVIPMPADVHVGLAVSSQKNNALGTAVFDQVVVNP